MSTGAHERLRARERAGNKGPKNDQGQSHSSNKARGCSYVLGERGGMYARQSTHGDNLHLYSQFSALSLTRSATDKKQTCRHHGMFTTMW
eukprot:scaffold39969_cov20-Tisochrysis_lutea.AAC.2